MSSHSTEVGLLTFKMPTVYGPTLHPTIVGDELKCTFGILLSN